MVPWAPVHEEALPNEVKNLNSCYLPFLYSWGKMNQLISAILVENIFLPSWTQKVLIKPGYDRLALPGEPVTMVSTWLLEW